MALFLQLDGRLAPVRKLELAVVVDDGVLLTVFPLGQLDAKRSAPVLVVVDWEEPQEKEYVRPRELVDGHFERIVKPSKRETNHLVLALAALVPHLCEGAAIEQTRFLLLVCSEEELGALGE